MITVLATREGLIGHTSATGYIIEKHVPFVALPSETAKYRVIRVSNGQKSCVAIVLDVGPHYTDDDDYVLRGSRPRAESDGSNGAGIDLGEYVWRALGMTDNGLVEWSFLA